jgi:hypothetical protein
MNKLKGPNIDLTKVKVPPALRDLYQDLRDRRLLPLVGLILVAILAVPFLLSDGGTEVEEAPLAPVAPQVAAGASSIEVVKATPGLREPNKRLADRNAKDPFKQHFVGSAVSSETVVAGAVTGGESSASSGSTEVTSAPAPSESTSGGGNPHVQSGGSPSSPSGGADPAPGSAKLVTFTYAATLKIVKTETTKAGKKIVSEPEERDRVLPSTVLPSPKQQVVTYMGISPKTRKPLLLVSTDVTAIFGEGKCASGTDICQLLEVEPTFPETFVYGENDVRYKINVLKVEPVVTGHS